MISATRRALYGIRDTCGDDVVDAGVGEEAKDGDENVEPGGRFVCLGLCLSWW